MVASVRSGRSEREVAREFHVALSTVQLWVGRAAGKRLDRADWSDRSACPHHPAHKTASSMETQVLKLRQELKASALGEFGAAAIYAALLEAGEVLVPCERTIHRILVRKGALDVRRRVRRPAPPLGWYLPDAAARRAEIDEVDIVTGLVIAGGLDVEVLNLISLHGGQVGSFPSGPIHVRQVREALICHWQGLGLPAYAQFDNDTRFLGPTNRADILGTVARMCLSLGIIPVFAPPRETGFQAAVESYNCRWQDKVWHRFQHASLENLVERSDRYVAASHRRHAQRADAAPARQPFPDGWQLSKDRLQAYPSGRVVFIRRTNSHGEASVLGHVILVDEHWVHRLVRCELDLDAACMRFFGLRRAEPDRQPLLCEHEYRLPRWRSRIPDMD